MLNSSDFLEVATILIQKQGWNTKDKLYIMDKILNIISAVLSISV